MKMTSTLHRLRRQKELGEIDGFTLLEILIVIVVLGILAAVVIFALGGITGKSAQAACAADGATVLTAMADFENQNPTTLPTGGSASNMITGSAVGVPYLESWPNNTPHYGYVIGTGGTGGTKGQLYVVTGSYYVSPGVYATSSANGNLTLAQVTAASALSAKNRFLDTWVMPMAKGLMFLRP